MTTTGTPTGSRPAASPPEAAPAQRRPRRVRRTGEEARKLILDAAERRLAEIGPEGIRLQDIAADVGISHPAILHHFQNREGLVAALVERTMAHLRDALVKVIERGQSGHLDTDAMMDAVFDTLSDRGHARLLAWLTLTNRVAPAKDSGREMLRELTDLVHAMLSRAAAGEGKPPPDKDETRFYILLAATTAFGEAIVGSGLYQAAGLTDIPSARSWFRERVKRLVDIPRG